MYGIISKLFSWVNIHDPAQKNRMSNAKYGLKELINARQNKRVLLMSFPENGGSKAMLLPDSLCMSEEMSRDVAFAVELLAEDARIPLLSTVYAITRGKSPLINFLTLPLMTNLRRLKAQWELDHG